MKTRSSSKIGLPPGSLVHIGDSRDQKINISVIDFEKENCTELKLESPEECVDYMHSPTVTWINFDGIHDPAVMKRIGETFSLHELLMEDIMNTTLRPKYEEFEDYVFFSLKMLSLTDSNRIRTEQVSIVLGQKWVISFQETPGDIFDPIRERIRQGKGKVRGRLSDYLVYLLLDVVVDNYYVITESIDARVEKLEDEVMNHPSKHTITKIQNLKKELIFLRKEILPLKEEIGSLSQDDELVEERNLKYFRDVRDHLNQVVDSLDSSREVLNSLVDLYHSTLSTQMNQVMKVLTIVATIFIPLTFVAGIYGMNFNPEAGSTNMPEIRWEYGYLYFWGLILVILVGMIFYFRSKKWL